MRKKLFISKYVFSLGLVLYATIITEEWQYVLYGLIELSVIFSVTNLICKKNHIVAYFFNIILLFIFNAETLILIFSGQYLKMIMIGNLASFESLSGQFSHYAIGVVLLVLFTFFPINYIDLSSMNNYRLISAILFTDIILLMLIGPTYSSFYSLKTLYDEKKKQDSLVSGINGQSDKTSQFFNKEILSYIDGTPFEEPYPNIVIVFVEGLSQNVVEDKRSIMPIVNSYKKRSLSFEDYYNHTAATYRGIISQLYSGYQAEDTGGSNTLVSIQSILADKGYHTTFINTEPKNDTFTFYLNGLGFDNVVTSRKTVGENKSVSDKQAFELLMSSMEKVASLGDDPFLICMYTFGTHNTFDSPDQIFGDGDNALFNKFYNLDYQFGQFMEFFINSSFFNNTIVVFTSDHCTYYSEDFRRAFPEYEREGMFIDRIPFFVFYNGVEAQSIKVGGRNSLDFAPTVLDFLGISAPNYFLGSSLFNPKTYSDSLETLFYAGYFQTSRNSTVEELDSQREKTARTILSDYFIAIQQNPKTNND